MKRHLITSAVVIALVAALALVWPGFETFLLWCTFAFIKGFSVVRIYLLAGWLVAFIVVALWARMGIRSTKKGERSMEKGEGSREKGAWRTRNGAWRMKALVVGSVALAFGFGVCMQVWFDLSYGVGLTDVAVIGSAHELTESGLGHIHFGKSPIGVAAGHLVPDGEEDLDTGAALVPFTPVSFEIACALAFLACAAALAAFYVRRVRELDERHVAVFVLGFATLSGLILARIVDGGFLSQNGILACGLLCAVVCTGRRSFWTWAGGALAVQIAFYAFTAAYLPGIITDPSLFTFFTAGALGTWGAIALLLGRSYGPARIGKLCCAVALIVCAAVFIEQYSSMAAYENTPVRTGYVGTYRSDAATDARYSLVGKIRGLGIYRYSASSTAVLQTIDEIVRDQGALYPFWPVSVPGRTCVEGSRPSWTDFALVSSAPISSVGDAALGVRLDVEPHGIQWTPRGAMYAYRALISMPICMPRPLSVLYETIEAAGAGSFVIPDLR